VNASINTLNSKWYDGRITVSPAVTAIESAVALSEGRLRNRARAADPKAGGLYSRHRPINGPADGVVAPLVHLARDPEPQSALDPAGGLVVLR
jgi:hypothetical protein